MTDKDRSNLEKRVIFGARDYRVSVVLFRHAIGDMLSLNVADMACLGMLFIKGVATPSELSKYTGLSPGATTAMLDRLEKQNIIERRPNPQDRRGVHIAIVPGAAQRAEELLSSARASQKELVSTYSEAELELLAGFFEKSIEMWDREREKLS